MVVVLVGGIEVIEVVSGSVVVLVGGVVTSVDSSVVVSGVEVGSVTVGSVSVVVSEGVVTAVNESVARTDKRVGWSAGHTCCVGHFSNTAVAQLEGSCSFSSWKMLRERGDGRK
jgi:hypothetical protein